jgi:hypothetical protein
MNSPLWIRPARSERYKLTPGHDQAEDAWRIISGNTSATYGELVALARLGADVQVLPHGDADHRIHGIRRIMRLDQSGVMHPVD